MIPCRIWLVLATCFFVSPVGTMPAEATDEVILSGVWTVRTDPEDIGERERWYEHASGEPINLPGVVTQIGLGHELTLAPESNPEVFRGLHQRHRYVGPAWYTRSITVPADWEPGGATLCLERVIWKSTLWVNGRLVGSENSLSAPHRYDVGDYLAPGENLIAIRVDNRMQVDIGEIAHAYTDWTQTIWNGLVGKLSLRLDRAVSVEHICFCPQPDGDKAAALIVVQNRTGQQRDEVVTLQLAPENHKGPDLDLVEWPLHLAPGRNEITLDYPIAEAAKWSEFAPKLYRAHCTIGDATTSVVTGLRRVQAKGRRLLVNGKPTFLRGTLECCIFPKTGYPPTTPEGWDHVFKTVREYGLNHLRFHSWCPPEAAFESADRAGVYLQVELPNWTFKMGQRPEVDAFLESEGERILREYAHHPSLVMLSLGNELTGDIESMDAFVERLREKATHLLYTSTSYSFSPRGELPGPADDYFITQKSKTGWVRGQGFLNQTKPNTDSDYSAGLESVEVPLISHEVGQYHVYPNLAELPKYDGLLRALNFEAIANDLTQKRRRERADAYTHNSGKLAALLYKEDIERALRTPGLSGIQLLDLHDFSGQGTATVGLLDAFWDTKGVVSPEEFRCFCGPIIPLMRTASRTWKASQTFVGAVELANFGESPIENASAHWTIADQAGEIFASGTFDGIHASLGNGIEVGEIRASLGSITAATELTVTVELDGEDAANSWNIWVYPDRAAELASSGEVAVVTKYGSELFETLAAGRRALFLPSREEIVKPLDGRFVPVFWSPVHFENQPGTVGAIIDPGHPALTGFPTSTHTDWQWWELLAGSSAIDLDPLGANYPTIAGFVDKFTRNALPGAVWEARVGAGRLLVCTLDIESDLANRVVAAQLRTSLLNYMNSDSFRPAESVRPEQIRAMFKQAAFRMKLSKGSAHSGYPFTNLSDGNPNTFWHTDWSDPSYKYPYHIDFEMAEPTKVVAIDYTARQDEENGRIRNYVVLAAEQGGAWREVASGVLDDSATEQRIKFKQPVVTDRLRLTALSAANGEAHCAIADLRLVREREAVSVDELGVIDGFNSGE